MRIPGYDDLAGGGIGTPDKTPVSFGGFDFVLGSLSAQTRLPNGRWLRVWFAMDRGKPWRLVGNFDRKAELRLTITDEASDSADARWVDLTPPGKPADTAQLASTDLAKLVPYIDAAIGAILSSAKANREAERGRLAAAKEREAAEAAAALAELRKRGL